MVIDDAHLAELAGRVASILSAREWRLATAESCTGGWIAKILTDIPGSSAWFDGGCVTYSNADKTRLLNVSEDLLARHGAVSKAVAEAMASGARVGGADLSLAVTGIAGPGGGTEDKPVGTVWLAWSGPGARLASRAECFGGNRDQVRRLAVATALDGILTLARR